ncbi:Mov34/MPN/PAD-1 family protein [Nostoc sp. PA-18-2419]|uniref:Mov34/MPN/PAD-1 family protein n=1 Tax=Nostoc sp. PA-18-2419 TaxID=2575443 RepID=UPI0011097B8D|nr:Mov34/MPN/PAD-1 family protein [Nostoc sp. PA-18-2419]
MSGIEGKQFSFSDGIKAEIQRGIASIADHPSVNEIIRVHLSTENNSVDAVVAVQLGLPNKWMAAGASPNGVFAVEAVTFSFPQSFPIHAPTVKLRADFDRSLAHVQPGLSDEGVLPCIYDGDINELLHVQGLWAIVDQVVFWLEKAAMNQLIDPNQGWEPIRRDSLEDIIIADSDYLRSLINSEKGYVVLEFGYLKINKLKSPNSLSKKYFIYGQVGTRPLKLKELDVLFYKMMGTKSSHGRSLAVIVTPDKLPKGELQIADRYSPENVTNVGSLRERAKECGCYKNFERALSLLKQRLSLLNSKGATFPIAVVLCVRRPFHLIGESSDIELLPYIVEVGAPQLLVEGDKTPVWSAGHKYAITSKLLRAFSSEQPLPANQDVVLVGCGSVGSKIAIHMARSGAAPSIVIDKKYLSPHNAARHALLPEARDKDMTWLGSKARALALAIKGLGQDSKDFDADVTKAVHDTKLLQKLFPRETWAVINATASFPVREALAAIEPKKLRSRVIETLLYANGRVGLMTSEGPGRNPNSVDLIAQGYEVMRANEQLRDAVFAVEEPTRHYSVGQGCSSTTMIISDARISMLAASMATGIAQMRAEGLPDTSGRILVGTVTDDGMGLNWTHINVPPVRIVPINSNSSWTVRISECAHHKILKDYAGNPFVETGGILVGRISETQQAFIVTDVLAAPQDSQRSKYEFVLGTSAVKKMLEQYSSSCNYALYCLGTWHSHLSDSGPSERDLQTAMEVASSRSIPSVLLIRTPSSYCAVSASIS